MYLQQSMPPTLQFRFYKTPLDMKSGVRRSVFRFFPLSSTLCLNLIIPNITPGGLFSEGRKGGGDADTRKEFSISKVGSQTPRGLYTVGIIIGILRYCKWRRPFLEMASTVTNGIDRLGRVN